MISTKFDVVVFKKDMDNDDLPGFAKMIERNYDNGFRFLESFDAADLGFVVSSKSVEVAMSTAPIEGQDTATTVQEASDPTPIDPSMISGINKAYAQIERQRKDIYRLTMDNSDLEIRLRQIHGAANYKGNSHAAFRTYAIEVAAAGLAKLRPHDESKSELDHQSDNAQLAALPTMEQVQLDYEELKSLREANKRQGAIIDDLLRDKAELKAKADSLAESVMSITDMNSEIAAKREDAARVAFSLGVTYTSNGGTIDSDQIRKSFDQWWSTFHDKPLTTETGEGMMTVLDAKTLAHLAYNRGHSIGNGTMDVIQITGNADFENWWIEFRKENGFGNEQPETTPSESVFEGIMSELKDIAREYLGWTDFENGTVPSDSLYGQFWNAIHIRLHYAPIHETTNGDGNQIEYLESIANNIIQSREGQS